MRLVFLFFTCVKLGYCFFFRNRDQKKDNIDENQPAEQNVALEVPAIPHVVSKSNIPPTPDPPIKKVYVPGIKAEFWNNVTIEEFKSDAYLFKKNPNGNSQGI